MKKYRAIPEFSSIFPGDYLREEVVDLFISRNAWSATRAQTFSEFRMKENDLFGWESRVRTHLLDCDEDPNPDSHLPHQLVYVENKFNSEWIGPEGIFREFEPEPKKPTWRSLDDEWEPTEKT